MRKHAKSLCRVLTDNLGTEKDIWGAEVGVWKGELSCDLLKTFPNLFLFMIDLWDVPDGPSSMYDKDNTEEAMLSAMEEARRNTGFAGTRREFYRGLSVEHARDFGDDGMDFVFIDASHLYEDVRDDVRVWHHKVKPGGVLAGHDYNGVGDHRKGWGVKRAVDEFCVELGVLPHVEPGLVWWIQK